MEEIIILINSNPNDAELGQNIRSLYQNSPDLFIDDDKYIRLYAEFDNFRKRTQKERLDLISKAKMDALEPLFDLSDELLYAIKNSPPSASNGFVMLSDKLNNKLSSLGIEIVQTDTYDIDKHEVISVVGQGKEIIDTLSRGYSINGVIYRHPKVVLG
jgi:molecular chaperone GrpE